MFAAIICENFASMFIKKANVFRSIREVSRITAGSFVDFWAPSKHKQTAVRTRTLNLIETR